MKIACLFIIRVSRLDNVLPPHHVGFPGMGLPHPRELTGFTDPDVQWFASLQMQDQVDAQRSLPLWIYRGSAYDSQPLS